MKKEFFGAVWTLVGVTVGAGILGIPYVFYKAGFLTGLAVMIIISLIMLIVTLYLGEIILRTKGKHQLTGLAEKYLGIKGKMVMFLANVLSIYGALAAYTIGAGAALNSIFPGNIFMYSFVFFIILSVVIYFNITILDKFQSIFTPLKIVIAVILSLLLMKFVNFNNITGFSFYNLLIPYGVLLFAFTGISAIPEMNEELKNKKYLFYSIIVGMIITFLLYLLFTFSILGSVSNVKEVATTSLLGLGRGINIFANFFALFAMSTAFVGLGFALKENLTLDYRLGNFKSWLFVIAFPILILVSGYFDFVKLIELSGAVAVGIILLMILIIHSKAKKIGNRSPEYYLKDNKFLKIILAIIIIIGIIYSII